MKQAAERVRGEGGGLFRREATMYRFGIRSG
jgi:hypothetical protein